MPTLSYRIILSHIDESVYICHSDPLNCQCLYHTLLIPVALKYTLLSGKINLHLLPFVFQILMYFMIVLLSSPSLPSENFFLEFCLGACYVFRLMYRELTLL